MSPQDAATGRDDPEARLTAALERMAAVARSGVRCARSAAEVREIAAELHGMAGRMADAVPVALGITRVWRTGGTRNADDGLTIPPVPEGATGPTR